MSVWAACSGNLTPQRAGTSRRNGIHRKAPQAYSKRHVHSYTLRLSWPHTSSFEKKSQAQKLGLHITSMRTCVRRHLVVRKWEHFLSMFCSKMSLFFFLRIRHSERNCLSVSSFFQQLSMLGQRQTAYEASIPSQKKFRLRWLFFFIFTPPPGILPLFPLPCLRKGPTGNR